METSLIVALLALAGTLGTAIITLWNARLIERLRKESDERREASQRQRELSIYVEPLARSAYDLQSRLFNILKLGFASSYLKSGNGREKAYAIDNTTFLIAQYLCWTELLRREVQFSDLGAYAQTRKLVLLQDDVYRIWGTDRQPPLLRLFAGEQRAVGETLIQEREGKPSQCMGYGLFLKKLASGVDPLIDAIRTDVAALGENLPQATDRLTALQNKMIDLLAMVDPDYLRFPHKNRGKVALP